MFSLPFFFARWLSVCSLIAAKKRRIRRRSRDFHRKSSCTGASLQRERKEFGLGGVARVKKNLTRYRLPRPRPPVTPLAHQVQRWDLDARAHRSRLRRLNKFRSDILADPFRPAATESNSLLLDMSPGRESRAARAVEGRRKAAAGAIKGAKLALRDLADWKKDVLAERGAVVTFMRRADPALAFAAGASCGGSGGDGHVLDGYGGGAGTVDDAGPRAKDVEVDVVVADPSFLAKQEGVGGWAGNEGGRLRRHASWAETGGETGSSSDSSPTSVPANADSGDGRVERPVRDRSGSRGSFGGPGGGGSGGRSRTPAAGFLRALGALDPCVSALREARSSAKTGDRLSMALETLREHVKATLIDLMDLETSIPGEGAESEEEESANVGGGGGGDSAGSVSALTAAEAGSLDVKVAGLVRRLSGKEAGGDGTNSNAVDEAGNNVGGGGRGPPSLASVYEGGLRGAAEASEAEVDTTESLTARALGMVLTAVAGPLLWALDDAYQASLSLFCAWRHPCRFPCPVGELCRNVHAFSLCVAGACPFFFLLFVDSKRSSLVFGSTTAVLDLCVTRGVAMQCDVRSPPTRPC